MIRIVVHKQIKEKKRTMLRNNCRKILAIQKNFGKHLRTWVCHAKFPISQRFVLEKITCYSSMERKSLIPSKISTTTQLRFSKSTYSPTNIFSMNSVKEYYSALKILFDSFKLQLTNKEEVFKLLSNIDAERW